MYKKFLTFLIKFVTGGSVYPAQELQDIGFSAIISLGC